MTRPKTPGRTILTRLRQKVFRKALPPTHTSPLAVSPDTRVSQHTEGLTLLHIPTGQIFVCNRTAARIWQGATEGRSADELSEEMSRQFRIARDIAQRDTYTVVSQMELAGLIVRNSI